MISDPATGLRCHIRTGSQRSNLEFPGTVAIAAVYRATEGPFWPSLATASDPRIQVEPGQSRARETVRERDNAE